MRGIYLMMKWFGKKARTHLFHCNRTKSTVKNPRVERYGSITDEELLAKVPGRTKPIKNRYFEVMAYTHGLAEMQKVKSYLEQKLQRPVVVYRHLDEAEEHAHFLAKNAGPDGRALRLALSDFAEIKKQVARILGRTVSPRGTGRRQVSLGQFRADPQVLQLATDEYRTTVAWVQSLFDLYPEYDAISIAVVRDTGSYEIQRVDPQVPVADQVRYRRLKALNTAGREGIYFAPVLPEPDDQRLFRTLFLDDVPIGQLSALPSDAVIVQAGEHRYQVHIRVSEPLLAVEVSIAQRALSGRFEADRGAVDVGHYRQLPGFADWHYPEGPLVRIRDHIRPAGPAVSIVQLEAELWGQKAKQQMAADRLSRSGKKCWLDFFETNRALADRKYASYLHICGWTAAEIRLAVIAESEDIYIRHQTDIGMYLDRTVAMALAPTGSQGTVPTGIEEGPHSGKPHPPTNTGGDHGTR